MSGTRSQERHYGVVFIVTLVSCLLGLASSTETQATTICDTDPAAVPFRPTVDPTLLNALIDTLGAIDVTKTTSSNVSLLYGHTLHVTLDSLIDLGGADFIVTPGFGSLEVELAIPGWNANLLTSMTHAACRNCSSEYNSCVNGCDSSYNSCCTYFGCEVICGPIWVGCEGICAGAVPICETSAAACAAEGAGVNLLLSGYNFGLSFSSASVTQTADICVSADCNVPNPLESTIADLNGFTLHLFPTGDPLGIGSWLNGIISGLVNWALNIENTIAGFFETPEGDGVLILPFAVDIATDGCQPVQEVIDCAGGGCSTVDRPPATIGRRANLLFYGLPVAFLLGLLLWRRKR
jgi:hypothetical protein